ncbi:Gti1/Pac2 family-domain-containing protein [Phanerochaete sordida]|uniref:Gti1/Pac2 family-domain-containing protein n=1 Tax=Phanerochaete sordida TaxID=48140 RepID=A0A9P3FYG6_9APHY|nr:Gti1/Pac2 family-domain-containing protein [Phanerochaete sordida]
MPPTSIRPFSGYVETTADALRLIQAARCGLIPRITRRLNELERRSMIKTGAVFVFSVDESGIKRWTDGYTWTPSRISGNFLVYREVTERPGRGTYQASGYSPEMAQRLDSTVALKTQGLIKKTITVKIAGSDHHLICYYTQDDVRSGRLQRPTVVPELMALEIPHDLIQSTNFRYPPKLEPGPDGRLTRIRDSEESHEPSESPSPVERVNRSRSILGEDSSAFSQASFASSPPAGFFNQAYSGAEHQQADVHSGIAPHSSRNYYAHGMDPALPPASPSSPWQTSPYPQYSPSSPTEYSPHARHAAPQPGSSPEEGTWELRGTGVSPRARVGDVSTGWPPENPAAVLGQPPLASLGLRAQSSGMAPAARTGGIASSWSWDGHGPSVGFQSSSHREHSHRTAAGHRSSYSAYDS